MNKLLRSNTPNTVGRIDRQNSQTNLNSPIKCTKHRKLEAFDQRHEASKGKRHRNYYGRIRWTSKIEAMRHSWDRGFIKKTQTGYNDMKPASICSHMWSAGRFDVPKIELLVVHFQSGTDLTRQDPWQNADANLNAMMSM